MATLVIALGIMMLGGLFAGVHNVLPMRRSIAILFGLQTIFWIVFYVGLQSAWLLSNDDLGIDEKTTEVALIALLATWLINLVTAALAGIQLSGKKR